MAPFRTVISSAFLSLTLLAVSPAHQPTLVFGGSSYKAEAAILSAGSRAAAVKRLRTVPSVGVVNLNLRTVPRFRSNETDVAEYRISAGKNFSGIKRLRAALAANPVTLRALGSRDISIGRVVGVDISSNGSLRLYVL
jgi:hypothetical protein